MDSTLTTKETDSKTKMGLKKTFNKVEKLPEEKKLEVIESEESIQDKVLVELLAYFEQTKYKGLYDLDERRKYFSSCLDFLKSFKLTPKIISKFNTKAAKDIDEWESFGLYLSAMIQTSYNQGLNNFKFNKVNAKCFGSLLKGQPQNPMKITTKSIFGAFSLWLANNCSLTAETLEGNDNIWSANDCLVEIQNYKGRAFGWGMINCIIKSGNKETLETIKKQIAYGETNSFELTKRWV